MTGDKKEKGWLASWFPKLDVNKDGAVNFKDAGSFALDKVSGGDGDFGVGDGLKLGGIGLGLWKAFDIFKSVKSVAKWAIPILIVGGLFLGAYKLLSSKPAFDKAASGNDPELVADQELNQTQDDDTYDPNAPELGQG
jgi:hypothetical protein